MTHFKPLLLVLVLLLWCMPGVSGKEVWEKDFVLGDSVRVIAVDQEAQEVDIEVCASMPCNRFFHGYTPWCWGVDVCCGDDTVHVALNWYNDDSLAGTVRALNVAVNGAGRLLERGVGVDAQDNTLIIEWRSGGVMTVYAGREYPAFVCSQSISCPESVIIWTHKGKLNVDALAVSTVESRRLAPDYRVDGHDFLTMESPCGIWRYVGQDSETNMARVGGDYKLALVEGNSADELHAVYLEGARVCPSNWAAGRVKGILKPLPVDGQWSVKWLDSELNEVPGENTAVIDGNVMTVYFPSLNSSMRFARE